MIIGAPRCGTTVLAQYIESEYKNQAKIFQEPGIKSIYKARPTIDEINEFAKSNSDFIVRIFAHDFFQTDLQYNKLDLSKYYLIRIRRKNTAERILSHYVAYVRKSFYFSKQSDSTTYSSLIEPVVVDIDLIKKFVRYITAWDYYLDNFDYHMDVKLNADLLFEDIQNIVSTSTELDSEIMPRPANSQEIKEIIDRELALHLSKR
jgi:hypothetical protein